MRRIFDGMGTEKMPFISADYVLNILAVAYKQNIRFGNELAHEFPVKRLIERSFQHNRIGSLERMLQIQYLSTRFQSFQSMMNTCSLPKFTHATGGKRSEFIQQYGFSPFDFATWL